MWVYDASFAAERKNEEGETEVLPFSYAQNIIDARYTAIMNKLETAESEFYLTGSGNFRNEVAVTKKYKGNRKQPKPYHYKNVRNYLQFAYGAIVVDGMEADDMLAIRQKEEGHNSAIVSRDKDLRMVEGWHYGYPVANQPEKALEYIDRLGYLILSRKGKLTGGGMRWFFAQCLMGDRTDNIPGIPRMGDKRAHALLMECTSEAELYAKTVEAYQTYYDDEEEGYNRFRENAILLWMVDATNEDGSPKMWEDVWKD